MWGPKGSKSWSLLWGYFNVEVENHSRKVLLVPGNTPWQHIASDHALLERLVNKVALRTEMGEAVEYVMGFG